jgi:anti-anti-sigma factor
MSRYNHLNVSERDDVIVVRFPGCHLSIHAMVSDVGRELRELANGQDGRKLIVDFFGVEDVSSTMLGVLVMLRRDTAVRRGRLVLCGLGPAVRKFVDESMLNELFEIRETEADAFVALA